MPASGPFEAKPPSFCGLSQESRVPTARVPVSSAPGASLVPFSAMRGPAKLMAMPPSRTQRSRASACVSLVTGRSRNTRRLASVRVMFSAGTASTLA